MHSRTPDTGGEERVLHPRPWCAVYTKHQHEKTASELLARKGFEVFLPLYRAARRWKDRTKIVSLPVFPCYLFLRTSFDRKSEILQTPGVFWLVESGGRTCAVPDSEVEALRRITESSAKIEPHPYLRCGDYVRVREGALAGIEGALIQVRNRYRVVVSVDLLQKAVTVEVDFSVLERIEPRGGNRPAARRGTQTHCLAPATDLGVG
jgi:transcription antitermination factor NusG